jgi:hypothetical protein
MKKLMKWLASAAAITLVLGGCEKVENQVYYEGGTAPVVTSSATSVTLTPQTGGNQALAISWTNPNYRMNTGISSHDVTYVLEMDTVGANFKSPYKYVTTIARDLSVAWTVDQLNGVLGNTMRLTFGRQANIEIRITSGIKRNNTSSSNPIEQIAAPLTSNVVRFTATPFAPPPKVAIPVTNQLFIVGSATAGDWGNPVPVPSQQFTKLSDTKYEISIQLKPGRYLFLPENGSWSTKYALENDDPGTKMGGAFVFRASGGVDLYAPDEAGRYKITVDFQLGIFTLVKL